MTTTPQPDEAGEAEAIAIDLAIDALADRRQSTPDPALAALAGFARAIDRQAAAMTNGQSPASLRPSTSQSDLPSTPLSSHLANSPLHSHLPSTAGGQTAPRVDRPEPAGPGRPRRRRRLFAVPMAVALALGLAGPLSISSGASQHSLQRLLQPPSPVESARSSLVNAEQMLDHAGGESRARATDLDRARSHLAEARRQLTLVTEAATRFQLITKLASLEHRAAQLAEAGSAPIESELDGQTTGEQSGPGGNPTPTPHVSPSDQGGSDQGDKGKGKGKDKDKDGRGVLEQ